MVGGHVAAHARAPHDADRLRARLARANRRWDDACRAATERQHKLQHALVHNTQFHDIGKLKLYMTYLSNFFSLMPKYF